MKPILVLFFAFTVFSASWNEIFNNDSGKSVYIITGQDGKPAASLDNRIALVSPND